jgi:alkylated DNA nucleotide flippase Atl1
MSWEDLVAILEQEVPAGRITTFFELSLCVYGRIGKYSAVRAMLAAARKHGFQELTNRVVTVDGKLAVMPDGSDLQHQQLLSEGIIFTNDGRVDMHKVRHVYLRGLFNRRQ